MRLSCNGCRVLRKGCTDACTIRPCLQWIKSPDAQANATVFLAKFYGRAGLLNLLAAAPTDALRPAVFRSLLYEACGRIVNPVYGAVGLLWSGTWHMCQAAVEAVLKGAPIVVQVSADDAAAGAGPPINIDNAAAAAAAAYDIRHVFPAKSASSASCNKQWSPAAAAPPPPAVDAAAAATQSKDDKDMRLLRKVSLSKPKFKRTSSSSSPSKKTNKTTTTTTQNRQPRHIDAASPATEHHNGHDGMLVADHHSDEEEQHAAVPVRQASNSRRRASSQDHCDRHSASASLDTEEAASHVSQAVEDHQAEAEQPPPSMGLDLTLGLLTSSAAPAPPLAPPAVDEPAGCRQAAVDEPAGVIAFRFL